MSLDPVVLFFVLGVIGGTLKSDLELPKAFLEALTIFLLLSLGLKGGVAISGSDPVALVVPALALIVGALALTLIAFTVLFRMGRLSRIDAAATAAHYGSVSVITFVVAQTYLLRIGEAFSAQGIDTCQLDGFGLGQGFDLDRFLGRELALFGAQNRDDAIEGGARLPSLLKANTRAR